MPNTPPARSAPWRRAGLLWIPSLAIGSLILSVIWYWPWRGAGFGQDDPNLLVTMSDPDLSWSDKVFSTAGNRLRPVAYAGYYAVTSLAGNSPECWWIVNMVLLAAVATLVGLIIWHLTGNHLLAAVAAALIVTARFMQYQALTATGLMEGLASLLLVILAGSLLAATKKRWQAPALVTGVVVFALLILTHERFQFVLLGILAAIAWYPGLTLARRVRWAVAFVIPVLALNAYRALVLDVPLFVGTGSATDLGFSLRRSVDFTIVAVAQVFGVNLGEGYTSGLTFAAQQVWMQGASLLIAGLAVMLLVAPAVKQATREDGRWNRRSLALAGVFLAFAAGLLVPSVVTIRLEQRWLVGLYLLLVTGVGYWCSREWAGTASRRVIGWALLTLFAGLSIVMNMQYRDNVTQLHFGWAKYDFANSAGVLEPAWRDAAKRPTGTPIIIIDSEGNSVTAQSLQELVVANTGLPSQEIVATPSLADIPPPGGNAVVLARDPSVGWVRVDAGSPSAPQFLTGGDIYGDGWVGPSVTIVKTNPACRSLRVRLEPAPWGSSRVTVTTGRGDKYTRRLADGGLDILTKPLKQGETVRLRFSRAWVPARINAGPDERKLSARASLACS